MSDDPAAGGDSSARARREAFERASRNPGVGAYLLGWLFLLIWGCILLVTAPARGFRWLLHRSRVPAGGPAMESERVGAEPSAALGDEPEVEVPSAAIPPSAIPGASHRATVAPTPDAPTAADVPDVPDAGLPQMEASDLDQQEPAASPASLPSEFGVLEGDLDLDERDADGEVAQESVPGRPWCRQPDFLVALVYLELVMIAELLVIGFGTPAVGSYGVLLAVVLLHRSRTAERGRRRLLLVLTLPLVLQLGRLLVSPMEIAPLWQYLALAGPALVAAFAVSRVGGLDAAEIVGASRTRWDLLRQLPVVLLGLPVGLAEFAILHPESVTAGRSASEIAIASVVVFLCAGATQELLFRGVVQSAAVRAFGVWPGIAWAAAMLAVLAVGTLSLPELAFVFGVGLLFGAVAQRTGSILGVSLAHGLASVVLLVLAPMGLLPLPARLAASAAPTPAAQWPVANRFTSIASQVPTDVAVVAERLWQPASR